MLVPWLRRLGFRADEARRAAALCETIPNASLEERVRVALSYFHPKTPSRPRVGSKNLGTAAGLAGADHIREEPVTINSRGGPGRMGLGRILSPEPLYGSAP